MQIDNTGKQNDITTDTTGKAEVLSDFVASLFTKEPPRNVPSTNQHMLNSELLTMEITKDTVQNKTGKTKHRKIRERWFTPRVLKELSSVLAEPLHIIFNTSICTSKCPDDWRLANITAIHKKDDKN